jgi:pentatricopeptide repeat protein
VDNVCGNVPAFILNLHPVSCGGQITADVVTYTALIKTCQGCGDADRALKVLGTMRGAGVSPNVKTFTTLVSALAKAGEWQLAVSKHLLNAIVITLDIFVFLRDFPKEF